MLRCAIIKVLFGFSYEELAFHIVDSQSIRWFCRIGIADEGFKKSALNKNIKAISEQTWQAISRHILGYAKKENIEKGRSVRVDWTNKAIALQAAMDHYATLIARVINQTRRRVIHGEKVPAKEKVVSIFEPHTDIIIKDRRDTYYGHKTCLTAGASNLILDCMIVE